MPCLSVFKVDATNALMQSLTSSAKNYGFKQLLGLPPDMFFPCIKKKFPLMQNGYLIGFKNQSHYAKVFTDARPVLNQSSINDAARQFRTPTDICCYFKTDFLTPVSLTHCALAAATISAYMKIANGRKPIYFHTSELQKGLSNIDCAEMKAMLEHSIRFETPTGPLQLLFLRFEDTHKVKFYADNFPTQTVWDWSPKNHKKIHQLYQWLYNGKRLPNVAKHIEEVVVTMCDCLGKIVK